MTILLDFVLHPGILAHAHPHNGVDIAGVGFAILIMIGLTALTTFVLSRAADVVNRDSD